MRTLALLLAFLVFAPTSVSAETKSKKTSMMNGSPLINSPYTKSSERSTGPSVFTRVGQGTKSFFSKTIDVLTSPFQREKPENTTVSSFPSWQQSSSDASSRWSNKKEVEEDSPGWFGSLFQQNEAPHPSRTVSDFLGQERPGGGL